MIRLGLYVGSLLVSALAGFVGGVLFCIFTEVTTE